MCAQANSSYPRGPSAWGAYEDPLAFVAGFLGWFAPSNIKASSLQQSRRLFRLPGSFHGQCRTLNLQAFHLRPASARGLLQQACC